MILEPIGSANIRLNRPRISMPGNFHDSGDARAVLCSGGNESSAQRVAGQALDIKAGSICLLLDDQGHRLSR